jgi:hypothetical protein
MRRGLAVVAGVAIGAVLIVVLPDSLDWLLSLSSLIVSATIVFFGIRQRRATGQPWISKNPDDYY